MLFVCKLNIKKVESTFKRYSRLAAFYRFDRYIFKLAYPYASSADGLNNQIKTLILLFLWRTAKPFIFFFAQFLFFGAVNLPLKFYGFHFTILPA